MDEFKEREQREEGKMLQYFRKLEPKHFKYINMGLTLICILFFTILYFQIKKASLIVAEDIKANTIYVHDTVTIKIEPPKIYYCWDCREPLTFMNNNATCCGFIYHILDGKLIGER